MQVTEEMKYTQLRKIARDLGIPAKGKKEDLVAAINAKQEKSQKERVEEVKTGVGRVASILVSNPQAMTTSIVQDDLGRSQVVFVDSSRDAAQAREEIREILDELWQSGAYNFEMIAQQLRVTDRDVQAMIDIDYIEKNNLE